MDEFERNEINENPAEEASEAPKTEETSERNTNAPSGWTYSANTNQYVSWDGSSDSNNAQWNPGQQQKTEQQPPRREYGTQYGYYGGQQQTNYYSSNGNYQWDFNKYESAEQNSAPKKRSGGKGFICLTSTKKNKDGTLKSNIVPYIPGGSVVSAPRGMVQYVATEYGIAKLSGLSLQERANAMISIAHPDFRAELSAYAQEAFR